ncbi:MAG: ATP-dependent protease [Rickettsiaceae bacterium]|nr:ATP-dependent protease [Rickettsiaceae bacterium]MDP4832801.1 ATP-dependent protease [Rickettsiaceae bacterium]MDP5021325.1 ATP-dependent protease [Rickettsiaceae bacterium]MDP5083333.1 ATP-dependent protease [Rickettsiaceae bacterium]
MQNKIKPIIFSLASTSLSEEETLLFKANEAVGFILFSRNIESRPQLIELTKSLKNLYPNRKVPIFVDQEGGRVARIKPPITKKIYPCAEHFSTIYDDNRLQAKHELKANYVDLMADLKSLGINSPCAPVCDILYPKASDVIGDRSFGDNADKVIDLCRSAISGIQHSGGLPFIKHIPGHGRATVDSHFELPIIETKLEKLVETDFKVFRELAQEKVWAMTAHIIYTALDPQNTATTSSIVIQYIREKIGFKGKLVSDDICMYALHGMIGKKNALLKKVINIAEKEGQWKELYSNELSKLLGINTEQIGNSLIIEICQKKLIELKPEFLESLAKTTKLSLEAGCDIILHCSGDLEEMRMICSAL